MIFKESILDSDEEIINKIDIEVRSMITKWLLENAWVSERRDFRRINEGDFRFDNNNCISLDKNKDVEGISLNVCKDVPTYIRFSYVSREFKINDSTVEKGDASHMLSNLTKEGQRDLRIVFICNTNIRVLGDLSKLDLYMFNCVDNDRLKMKPTELPHISVSITYKHNGNQLELKDIKRCLPSHGMALYYLDNKTNSPVNESIVDSDETIQSDIHGRYYLIVLLARYLKQIYGDRFDFNDIYTTKKCDYVYIAPKSKEENKILRLIKNDTTGNGKVTDYMRSLFTEIVDELYVKGLVKHRLNSVSHVNDYWFTAFKMGQFTGSDSSQVTTVYPSIGIRQYTIPKNSVLLVIDLGEEKYNRNLITYLKQIK